MGWLYFCTYAMYVISVNTTLMIPLYIGWLLLQVSIEIFQLYNNGKYTIWYAGIDFWKCTDYVRIILLASYIGLFFAGSGYESQMEDAFCACALVSNLNLVIFLRMFSQFRDLIEIIYQVNCAVLRFVVVFVIMVWSITVYFIKKQEFRVKAGESDNQGLTQTDIIIE
jgi:hypothetical protein